jgi:hypothetical protein
VPVQLSGWLPYGTSRLDYPWQLIPSAGVHYLQAWAADEAGNISLFPYKGFISYNAASDSIAQGQSRIYRYTITAGQQVTVDVTPLSGDPDLYVWAPDHATRPPWVSNASSGAEQVSFVAPVSGVYQIEVYGFTAAQYQIAVDVTAQLDVAGKETLTNPNAAKPDPSQPVVPVGSVPGDLIAIPVPVAAVPAGTQVFLPLVVH